MRPLVFAVCIGFVTLAGMMLHCMRPTSLPRSNCAKSLYLATVRYALSGLLHRTIEMAFVPHTGITASPIPLNVTVRERGLDWPVYGLTMIGDLRLQNIEFLLRQANSENVPGDFIECGVWRGGGSIFARAVLHDMGDSTRHVWLADSFEGLPPARSKEDSDMWSSMVFLRVSRETVEENFRSYGLLDDRVHFCKGYFKDSLPVCPVQHIAILRMDGDMYESTMDQLFNLYDKISIGGWIIVDDWTIEPCQRALRDFWAWHSITPKLTIIDESSVYWQKEQRIVVQQWRYKELLRATKPPTRRTIVADFHCKSHHLGIRPPRATHAEAVAGPRSTLPSDLEALRQMQLGDPPAAATGSASASALSLPALQDGAHLSLWKHQLGAVPDSVWQRLDLQTLVLADNNLADLSKAVGELKQLRMLDLGHNRLTAIPDEIGELDSLTDFLYLHDNQLTALPETLSRLTRLRYLNISDNRLENWPACLCQMTGLIELQANGNAFRELPASAFAKLSNLRELHLRNNRLSSLPPSIGQLSALRQLDLRGNPLTCLPDELLALPRLEKLDLRWVPSLNATPLLTQLQARSCVVYQ